MIPSGDGSSLWAVPGQLPGVRALRWGRRPAREAGHRLRLSLFVPCLVSSTRTCQRRCEWRPWSCVSRPVRNSPTTTRYCHQCRRPLVSLVTPVTPVPTASPRESCWDQARAFLGRFAPWGRPVRGETGAVSGTDPMLTTSPRGRRARGLSVTPLPMFPVSGGLLNRAPFPLAPSLRRTEARPGAHSCIHLSMQEGC